VLCVLPDNRLPPHAHTVAADEDGYRPRPTSPECVAVGRRLFAPSGWGQRPTKTTISAAAILKYRLWRDIALPNSGMACVGPGGASAVSAGFPSP
jgi:hypothetical protein